MTWSRDMAAAPRSTIDADGKVTIKLLLGFEPTLIEEDGLDPADVVAGVALIWWEPIYLGGCWVCDHMPFRPVNPTMWCDFDPPPIEEPAP